MLVPNDVWPMVFLCYLLWYYHPSTQSIFSFGFIISISSYHLSFLSLIRSYILLLRHFFHFVARYVPFLQNDKCPPFSTSEWAPPLGDTPIRLVTMGCILILSFCCISAQYVRVIELNVEHYPVTLVLHSFGVRWEI